MRRPSAMRVRAALVAATLCAAAAWLPAPRPALANSQAASPAPGGERAARQPDAARSLPDPVRATLGSARLAGSGTLRWLGFRVYEARLWSGDQGLDPQAPTSRPFALELRYARSLSGAAIAERSAQEIERLGRGDPAARRDWLEAMRRLFPDVAEGDRIVGLHRPGEPTRFYLNDRPLGQVADPRFGPAFFAIWFDEATVAPALREALLGGAAPLATDEGGR